MTRMIAAYNFEVTRFAKAFPNLDKKARENEIDAFIDTDPTRISWTHNLKAELIRGRQLNFQSVSLTPSLYRPYTKQWLCYDRRFNERVNQMPRIFPDAKATNLVICVAGPGAKFDFCSLIVDTLPNLGMVDIGVTQCFPLYLYDEAASEDQCTTGSLFEAEVKPASRQRRDAITNEGLAYFQAAYPGEALSKEDLFYYVYGLLHAPGYRERYADTLAKELPRIPCVKTAADFWAFSQAGRKLADLHLNYEVVTPYPVTLDTNGKTLADADYRIEQMKYGKAGKDKNLSTLHVNAKITLRGIPLEAYGYVVNGKPALDWVVERQCVKTHKDSGIINDANDWATETMGNPRYPLELFQRIFTVSIETMKIVRALPALDITG